MSRLQALPALGQSVWLDYIRCDLLTGPLQQLITNDGLLGLTSNPAIFEKAIAGSSLYNAALSALVAAGQHDASAVTEALAVADIRSAAAIFAPVYAHSKGADGFVSLEVAPELADDAAGTVAAGKRLWAAVNAPNLMIKVPATPAGLGAIRQLIGSGINVNVTLIFSREVAAQVALTYQQGLQDWVAQGGNPAQVASVASFFISRIDAALAPLLHAAPQWRNTIAIANAKLAYQDFMARQATSEWQALAQQGARPQRLLWASTATKDPALRDVLYLEQLVGANTVNTVPPATLDAFRDHGEAAATLHANLAQAQAAIAALPPLGIHLNAITQQLLADGLQLFATAHQQLLNAVSHKIAELRA